MLILRLSRKRYKVANKVKRWKRRRIRDHTLKPIRLMKTVAVGIRSYVATMTNIANQSRCLSSLPLSSISCADCCRHSFVMNISVEWKFLLSIEGMLITESISSIFAWPPPVLTNPHRRYIDRMTFL